MFSLSCCYLIYLYLYSFPSANIYYGRQWMKNGRLSDPQFFAPPNDHVVCCIPFSFRDKWSNKLVCSPFMYLYLYIQLLDEMRIKIKKDNSY
jgi:hypothetical protein